MKQPKIHFIGIGGIGMSALAQWFLSKKWLVSGSDASDSPIIQFLKKQGVEVKIGHKSGNFSRNSQMVVYSAAVPPDNPEFKKAKELGIKTLSYSEALAELTKQYKTIAVSGMHGKSTTTAMLANVLIKAGMDPTVIFGSKYLFDNQKQANNFRLGNSQILVIEADEYRDHFLNYSPFGAIITNINLEHVDYFKNLQTIKKSFIKFINGINKSPSDYKNGPIVLNADDKNIESIKNKLSEQKITWFSLNQKNRVRILKKNLKVIGKHNIANALAVWALAEKLGIKQNIILKGLKEFTGIWRRLEYKGEIKFKNQSFNKFKIDPKQNQAGQKSKIKIKVYDDYAHHPTEIRASLNALRENFKKSDIICVFQPHQQKRLEALFKEFSLAFDEADYLVLLDIFKVVGRDSSVLSKTNKVSQNQFCNRDSFCCKKLSRFHNAKNVVAESLSEQLAYVINKRLSKLKNIRLKKIIYLPYSEQEQTPKLLKEIILNNPPQLAIIVMMGAGDIYKITDKLIE